MLNNKKEAYQLLIDLGAPNRLLKHVQLVNEVAEFIFKKLTALHIEFDQHFVELGIIIHDVGKIIYQNELDSSGSEHEEAGEKLLLENEVQPEIARCCLSHARWKSMTCSFEELLVALADKLWKGKRVAPLELKIIDALAEKLNKNRWDIFVEWDQLFEEIAADGIDRLNRSV
ncbi:MAG: phosphohydrolase [Candidatus Parabeggiatoa sp. nov. 3]|nr:MAG: phosphohydrolase [Gammaproteobacteria bacterium]RKZ53860.1 MAG: phosphohydrolase [Gammaproteobacteria bacterium]RKZ75207.1 MAG: phosphohydrolase [Gammaproteobacteria bacterium]